MENQDNKMNVRKKIVSSTVSLLLIVSIFLCLFILVQVLSKGYVSLFGCSFFRVVTGSMEPSIRVGELILTKQQDFDEISEGDVISFRSQSTELIGKIVTHRVVKVLVSDEGEIRFLTKGDANPSVDGYYITEDIYIGTVVWNSGDGFISQVMSFFTGRVGFLACVVFPCLLLSALILRENVGSMKRDLKNIMEQLETETPSGPPEVSLSSDEYERLREKIRAELVEELNQRGDSAGSQEDPQ